jgi:hypothetical protein
MRLSDFKKELKKRNVSYKTFMTNFMNDKYLSDSVCTDAYMRNYMSYFTFERLLEDSFNWADTPEGVEFWDDICCGGICISPRGAIFQDYAISTIPRSHTGSWSIGSSVLTTARKLRLFKLLAKDLGYEIEG